jgi:hypothetical protein
VLGVAAAVAVVALEVGLLLPVWASAKVIVNDAVFEYDTPPTQFCPFTYTVGGPPATLIVPIGSAFNLSWGFGCESVLGENSSSANYTITSVMSMTWGFHVVGSNLPVSFGYGRAGTFNVTVRAPNWPWASQLILVVEGGPQSSR